jgi:uncharacterized protein (TIGR03083 family)
VTETYDATWLAPERYDALRASDFDLFVTAARTDLAAHVPTCPDWDVTGLCDHLARVYQGRSHVIEHGSFLDRDAFELRADGDDPVAWVQRWSARLDDGLRSHGDDDDTVTFVPDVTKMRFWRRRMALETLVHRTDAQLAVGDASPMDPELSADGVDELLWFASYPDDDEPDAGRAGDDAGSVVALTDGARSWRVSITDTAVATPEAGVPVDATVRGSAAALLLALSGRDLEGIGPDRFGVDLPVVEGDSAPYQRLLTRLGGF